MSIYGVWFFLQPREGDLVLSDLLEPPIGLALSRDLPPICLAGRLRSLLSGDDSVLQLEDPSGQNAHTAGVLHVLMINPAILLSV